jgi:predicted 2-oxoglutarate/Fe(II)-dependent dioxygenase YbiX
MLRYRGGQEYKAHFDGTTGSGRSVSAIVYLNNDYEGGHVEFTNFGVKIKPEPGMLLLFPSNYAYTHIAHPVTDGTKYAIVTWLHDRPL